MAAYGRCKGNLCPSVLPVSAALHYQAVPGLASIAVMTYPPSPEQQSTPASFSASIPAFLILLGTEELVLLLQPQKEKGTLGGKKSRFCMELNLYIL